MACVRGSRCSPKALAQAAPHVLIDSSLCASCGLAALGLWYGGEESFQGDYKGAEVTAEDDPAATLKDIPNGQACAAQYPVRESHGLHTSFLNWALLEVCETTDTNYMTTTSGHEVTVRGRAEELAALAKAKGTFADTTAGVARQT